MSTRFRIGLVAAICAAALIAIPLSAAEAGPGKPPNIIHANGVLIEKRVVLFTACIKRAKQVRIWYRGKRGQLRFDGSCGPDGAKWSAKLRTSSWLPAPVEIIAKNDVGEDTMVTRMAFRPAS